MEARIIRQFKAAPMIHISILEDSKGDKFIVRQDLRKPLYWHLSAVRNKVGALVAESVDIPANRVEIIPAHCEFPGKKEKRFPASLHTYVPGIMVKKLSKGNRVYIQQRMKGNTPKKHGDLPGWHWQIWRSIKIYQK